MDKYHDIIMIVYDLVVAEEKKHVAEEDKKFDEDVFLLKEFTLEEMGINSTQLLPRSKAEKKRRGQTMSVP